MRRKRNYTLLNRQTLERLLLYYHFINNNLLQFASGTVSSAQIAEICNTDETQVRKDFAAIGIKGRPRVGFVVDEVVHAIRGVLGFNEKNLSVIIGAGRLGGAIASYKGFVAQGLKIEGTPAFIVDGKVNVGYLTTDALLAQVAEARKAGCKMC